MDDFPIQPLLFTAIDLLANQTSHDVRLLFGLENDTTSPSPNQHSRLTREVLWSVTCILAFIWPCHKFCHDIATLASVKIEGTPGSSDHHASAVASGPGDGHEVREEVRTYSIEEALQDFYHVCERSNRIVLKGWRPGLDYMLLYELSAWGLTWAFGNTYHTRWAVHLTTSTALAGVRMRWTQDIVAHPSSPPPSHRHGRNTSWRSYQPAILLPSLAYAVAQPLSLIAAFEAISLIWGTRSATASSRIQAGDYVRVVATGLTPLSLAFCVLLPLAMILNRVEVLLLPVDAKTLVHCDALAESERKSLYGRVLAPSVRACRSLDWPSLKRAGSFYAVAYGAMFMVFHSAWGSTRS